MTAVGSASADRTAVVTSTPEPSTPRLFTSTARAELTKLRTVRSTMWSLLVSLVITVGLGALFCAARVARWDRLGLRARLTFDAAGFSLNGLFLAQLAIGVLGVLVISSEYATGQIRATFGATPQRRLVLGAKVLVFMATTFLVGLVGCVIAFGVGQSILAEKHAGVSLSDPTAARVVVGGALYLMVLGAFSIGLGAIIRRTAGAIAALVGVLLILPILTEFLPDPWNQDVRKYLPSEAGGGIFHGLARRAGDLAPWTGFALFCGYALVLLIVAAVLLDRRDA